MAGAARGQKDELREWLERIDSLLGRLGLIVNPKTAIYPTRLGVPFLGYRVWAEHRRVLRANVVAGRRRLRLAAGLVAQGRLPVQSALDGLKSWFAHLAHADSYQLRRQLLREARPLLGGCEC